MIEFGLVSAIFLQNHDMFYFLTTSPEETVKDPELNEEELKKFQKIIESMKKVSAPVNGCVSYL